MTPSMAEKMPILFAAWFMDEVFLSLPIGEVSEEFLGACLRRCIKRRMENTSVGTPTTKKKEYIVTRRIQQSPSFVYTSSMPISEQRIQQYKARGPYDVVNTLIRLKRKQIGIKMRYGLDRTFCLHDTSKRANECICLPRMGDETNRYAFHTMQNDIATIVFPPIFIRNPLIMHHCVGGLLRYPRWSLSYCLSPITKNERE